METRYFLELDAAPTAQVRDLLLAHGARQETALDWELPTEQAWAAIRPTLQTHGAGHNLFYEYVPAPADQQLAAFLPLQALSLVAPVAPGSLVALRDEDTNSTVVSARLTELLAPVTQGQRWEHVKGSADLLRLLAPALPDPVLIPQPIRADEGRGGVWSVRSDGRPLLTAANQTFLASVGMALAPLCAVHSEVVPWHCAVVVNQHVLRLLTASGEAGRNGDPVYLGQA